MILDLSKSILFNFMKNKLNEILYKKKLKNRYSHITWLMQKWKKQSLKRKRKAEGKMIKTIG